MHNSYEKKARIIEDIRKIEQYKPILEKDNFQVNEPHWRRISKNTITLFQVLIDQDLSDLVNVLKHYPQYTEWVCEHFRYAYSYSENYADIEAASTLLFMGEAYFSKQFVRNVMRKLPNSEHMTLEQLTNLVATIAQEHTKWHPVVTNHLITNLLKTLDSLNLHPLQKIVLSKPIRGIKCEETFLYEADDRDAVLDIPYMN